MALDIILALDGPVAVGEIEAFDYNKIQRLRDSIGVTRPLRDRLFESFNINRDYEQHKNTVTLSMLHTAVEEVSEMLRSEGKQPDYIAGECEHIRRWFYDNYRALRTDSKAKLPEPLVPLVHYVVCRWANDQTAFSEPIEHIIGEGIVSIRLDPGQFPNRYGMWKALERYTKSAETNTQ